MPESSDPRHDEWSSDDLSALVAALFAGLLDAEPWTHFLDRLATAAGATWATLILTPREADHPGILLTPGGDPAIGRDYAERLFADDPFTGLPDGIVTRFRDFVSPEMLRRNAAYGEFLTRISSDEVLGVDISESGGLQLRLRLTRAIDRPAFEDGDVAAFQRLVAHLRIALRLFDRLAAGESERRLYAGAVAQMAVGMILLDHRGEVMRLNARASTILAEQDGIALRGNRIVLDDSERGRQLHDRLARAEDETSLTLRIERPSGRGDLLLVVGDAQGHGPGQVAAGGGPGAVLYLNDPTHSPRVSPDAIRELLGVTPGEAAIAAEIADGHSLADIAERLGISPYTVRAHLRSIFAKTGVKRQSQLVHLVHHSRPGLARPGT